MYDGSSLLIVKLNGAVGSISSGRFLLLRFLSNQITHSVQIYESNIKVDGLHSVTDGSTHRGAMVSIRVKSGGNYYFTYAYVTNDLFQTSSNFNYLFKTDIISKDNTSPMVFYNKVSDEGFFGFKISGGNNVIYHMNITDGSLIQYIL